jgi:dihydrofolate synthase/folylpolyglutamate synthase
VWETGLGGKLDATNIVSPIITAITTIDYDHQAYLGDTLEKIAFEKAGIIKENVPLFTGKISSVPLAVINDVAKAKQAPIFPFDDGCLTFTKSEVAQGWNFEIRKLADKHFTLPVEGDAQPDNMNQAFAILQYMTKKYKFDLTKALDGLETLRWPGRNQILPDGRILDGAHNPQGIKALLDTLKRHYPGKKFDIIYGCMEERPPDNAISILLPIAQSFNFVPIESTRACFSPQKAAEIASQLCRNAVACKSFGSLSDALKEVKPEKNLITGSLYLAGDVLKVYFKEDDIVNINHSEKIFA